jgi:hypothetical protein
MKAGRGFQEEVGARVYLKMTASFRSGFFGDGGILSVGQAGRLAFTVHLVPSVRSSVPDTAWRRADLTYLLSGACK